MQSIAGFGRHFSGETTCNIPPEKGLMQGRYFAGLKISF
jgi:hypothetical protein